MGDMVDTRTLLGHVASLGAELTDLLAGYGHSSPKQRRVARDLREIANQCGPEPAIAAQCAPPPEPVVERFVPCVQCRGPVEESRKCVALPKCYACQPPAEPLPVAKPAPVHHAAPGTVFEWRVDAADEWRTWSAKHGTTDGADHLMRAEPDARLERLARVETAANNLMGAIAMAGGFRGPECTADCDCNDCGKVEEARRVLRSALDGAKP